jgi:hypothetical protein
MMQNSAKGRSPVSAGKVREVFHSTSGIKLCAWCLTLPTSKHISASSTSLSYLTAQLYAALLNSVGSTHVSSEYETNYKYNYIICKTSLNDLRRLWENRKFILSV